MEMFLMNDRPTTIEIQKQRYGDRLYERNPKTGTYRCFFCNKELKANFSRHITRHEVEGDTPDEELKQAILKELPQPPSSNIKSSDQSPNAVKRPELDQMTFSTKPLSYIQTHPSISPLLPTRHQLEQQFHQILFYFTRKASPGLLHSLLVTKFLTAADQQITAPNHTQVNSFYSTICHIAKQLVVSLGNRQEDVDRLKEMLHILQRGYREELSKMSLQRHQRYRASCSICLEGPTSSNPLIPCNGDCVRTFHLSCASYSKNVEVSQVSSKHGGWITFCSDCKEDRKVLRWDPYRKQHFYIEFHHDTESEPMPAPVLTVDDASFEQGTRVERGAGREITLILGETQKPDPGPLTIPLEIPENAAESLKKQFRKDETKHQKEKWFDPYWRVWRYTTSDGVKNRFIEQSNILEPSAKRTKLE